MFQCFPLPELALDSSFLAISLPFLLGFKICFAIEFSEFLYVGQDGRNEFLEPIFFGFVLRLLNSSRLKPQKAHNRSVYTFHPYHWPAVKLSVNSAVFGSGSALWITFVGEELFLMTGVYNNNNNNITELVENCLPTY